MKAKRLPVNLIIYFILLAVSIAAVIICVSDADCPYGYEKLFLLPLAFNFSIAVFYFPLFKKKSLLDNLPCSLFVVLTFLRNVITPIVMVKDSYVSVLGVANANHANFSIWLVFYETIVMYAFMYVVETYRFKQHELCFLEGKSSSQTFRVILFAMVCISALSFVFVPELMSHYHNIFSTGFMKETEEYISYRGNIFTRVLGVGGDIATSAVRFVLPCCLFYKLAAAGETVGHLCTSLFIVCLQCLFMTASNAYILMLMISQVLFIVKLYPRYRRAIWGSLTGLALVFAFAMYFNRFALNHYGRSLSRFLQAYIPGIANTAGIFNVVPRHNVLQIFKDFWVAVPFKAFLGIAGNTVPLPLMWASENDCAGQIMSTVSESFYYFGSIFAPLLSCLLLQISRKCLKMTENNDNALLVAVYIYLMIYSAVTPFVYNFYIYMCAFLERTIFLFLIAYFAPYKFSDIKQLKYESAKKIQN